MTRRRLPTPGRLLPALAILLLASPAWAAGAFTVSPTPNPSSAGSELRDVAAIRSNDVWAVGTYEGDSTISSKTLAQHWNGTKWSTVTTPNPGSSASCAPNNSNALHAVSAASTSDVWAVGSYSSCSLPKTLAEHWNGTKWATVKTPNPGTDNYNELHDVAALGPNDAWAVGYFYANGEAAQTLAIHWNGTKWSKVATPSPGTSSVLEAIAAASPGELWASGYMYSIDTGDSTGLLLHYTGGLWKTVTLPAVPGEAQLYGVAAASAGDAWAVGYQEVYPEAEQTLVLHWNGTTWSVVPSPNQATDYGSQDRLTDVAIASGGNVYAVGWFASESTEHFQHRSMVQHWDGHAWTVQTSPSPGKSADLVGVSTRPNGRTWTAGLYSINGYDIYSHYYLTPKTLILTN